MSGVSAPLPSIRVINKKPINLSSSRCVDEVTRKRRERVGVSFG